MRGEQGGAMRSGLFLCLFFAGWLHLTAQNVDPPTLVFTGAAADSSRAARAAAHFVLGWNWSVLPPDGALSDSLGINTIHMGIPIESHAGSPLRQSLGRFPRRVDLIAASREISQSDEFPYAWAPSMQWDPTLGNTAAVEHDFTPRPGDTTGAVWGFEHSIVGYVPTEDVLTEPFDKDHYDYDRALYDHADLEAYNAANGYAAGTPQLVLSGAQPDNELFVGAKFERSDQFRAWGLANVAIKDPRVDARRFAITDTSGNAVTLPVWADTLLRGGDTTLFFAPLDQSEWYLSLNMRRRSPADHTPGLPAAAVLSLRLRVIERSEGALEVGGVVVDNNHRRYDTTWASFDSVSAAGGLVNDPHYGLMDDLLSPTGGDHTTWTLTKDMFEPDDPNQPAANSVTRSAHFFLPAFWRTYRYAAAPTAALLDGEEPAAHEVYTSASLPDGMTREWHYGTPKEASDVVQMGGDTVFRVRRRGVARVQPQVTYHGGYDIGVDWLRIESRAARTLLRGGRDGTIAALQQADYDGLAAVNAAEGVDLRLLRHYLADETPAAFWRASRHLHLLLERAGSVELDLHHALHARHQSAQRQYWHTWALTGPLVAAPYLPLGDGGQSDDAVEAPFDRRGHRCLRQKLGYRGGGYPSPPPPDMTFDYETSLFGGSGAPPDMWTAGDQAYEQWVGTSARIATFQPHYEFNTVRRLADYQEAFADTAAQVWVNPWIHYALDPRTPDYAPGTEHLYRDKALWYANHRPKTAEEFDLYMWTALLMGAKGVLYYKGGANFHPENFVSTSRVGIDRTEIRSDAAPGGDFIDAADPFFAFMDVDSLARCMGLNAANPRFYVGAASLRDRMLRLHDWIRAHEGELLDLRLQAWWNKGYRAYGGAPGGAHVIDDFLDLDLERAQPRLVTAPLHTAQGAAWPADSAGDARRDAFVAFSVLARGDVPLDSVFYLGVLNRRTDPAVYDPLGGGTDLGAGMKFYSALEFDTLAAGGRLPHYARPDYARRGARRITIPFDVNLNDVYVNLRVREVGGALDTMLRADQSLALDFHPGQGRLLRVEVIKPDLSAAGGLDYHNQRKLIARPEAEDMMVYHMVYHRPAADDSTRLECYYRRSTPVAPVHADRPLSWERTEVRLGATLTRGAQTNAMVSAGYPALTVREDSLGVARVYVVYACREDFSGGGTPLASPDHVLIGEQVFRTDADLTTIAAGGRYVAAAWGAQFADWGTPTVGAAATGNFIAWSDSLLGIGVVQRAPAPQEAYSPPHYVHRADPGGPVAARHPALTSYARLDMAEDDLALVWQETFNGDELVFYTRIELQGGLPRNFIQTHYTETPQEMIVRERSGLLRLGLPCMENRRPMVYRHIEHGNTVRDRASETLTSIVDLDQVVWEARRPAVGELGHLAGAWQVHHAAVLNVDGVPNGQRNRFRGQTHLPGRISARFSGRDYSEPNIAQGDYVRHADNVGSFVWRWNEAYDAVLLNLRSGADEMRHFPLAVGCWSQLWDRSVLLTDYWLRSYLTGRGRTPQLAAMPYIDADGDIRRSRRVYAAGGGAIVSTAQHMHKSGALKEDLTYFLGFADVTPAGCPRRGTVGGISIGGAPPQFEDPRAPRRISVGTPPDSVPDLRLFPDTVRSMPFAVGMALNIDMLLLGEGSDLLRLDLVRTSDGARTPLSLPQATDSAAVRVSFDLTNGNGELFRLEFYAATTAATFVQELISGEIPVEGETMARRGAERRIVNLAAGAQAGDASGEIGIAAWPVPADKVLNVGAWINDISSAPPDGLVIDVWLVDLTGRTCGRWSIPAGGSTSVDAAHLQTGVYLLHAEAQNGRHRLRGATTIVLK